MVSWSWKNCVTKECISGAFRKAGFGVHTSETDEVAAGADANAEAEDRNIFDRMKRLFNVDFDDYVGIDRDVHAWEEELTGDEIVEKYDSRRPAENAPNEDEDVGDEEEEADSILISHKEALSHIEQLRVYFQAHDTDMADTADKMQGVVHNLAAKAPKKQLSMMEFLTK